jgi:hypothetical protein
MTFTVIPNELIQDHDLTLIETRVLIALYSFRNPRTTNTAWPGRVALAERCGYHVNVVSKATTRLERKGWIRKVRRGKKQTNVYEMIGKGDVTELVSSPKSDLTDPVSSDQTDPVTSIGIDHLIDQQQGRRNGKGKKPSLAERAAKAEARTNPE